MSRHVLAQGLMTLLAALPASTQQASPSFAVASIKVNNSVNAGMGGTIGIKKGGRIGMSNVTLRTLIELAYGVEGYRVSGGPAWIADARYNVEAKPAATVDDGQARLMLQSLLTERFQLRVHHQTATVSGYRLVVEKGGSKLRRSVEDVGFRVVSPEEIHGPADMPMLVHALKLVLGAPVEDDTALEGKYDIELKWKQENSAAPAPVAYGASAANDPELTIFTALKQQLGLSLKAGRVPMDMIVVDHAERTPTAN